MKATVALSIIIVNWRSCAYLRQCLASLPQPGPELEFEVMVVDNASFDGCEAMIAEQFPQVQFLQLRENVGFAKANNLAAQRSRGDTLLFLNPDTEVIGRAIHVLYQRLQTLPDAGAAGCKLCNSDGSVQTSCIQSTPTILNQLLDSEILRRWHPRSRLWGMRNLFGEGTDPRMVEMVSGAGLMVKKRVFEEVGLFSIDYFMYAEDVDLCYKIRKAGHAVYYVPEASIVHHGGMSSGQAGSTFSAVVMRESIWKFLTKTRGFWYGAAYRASVVLSGLVRVLLLSLALPALLCLRGLRSWQGRVSKWVAILCWGLGVGNPRWRNLR